MEGFVKGDVVVIDFPFTSLQMVKRRPALILQIVYHDAILAEITSSFHLINWAIPLSSEDFSEGGIRIASIVRADRIFTCDQSLIAYRAGRLTREKLDEVIERVCAVLRR